MKTSAEKKHRIYRRFSLFALGYSILVILWGAFVRASGSGSGCGSHWPLCQGEVIVRSPQLTTMIELFHRATSGLALVVVVILLILAFRFFPKNSRPRMTATLSTIFMLLEAGVGAALVLLRLTGNDTSAARAIVIALHLCNTLLLLGALTANVIWSRNPVIINKPFTIAVPRPHRHWSMAMLLAMFVVGATGAIVALGDTLFPAESLAAGLAQHFSDNAQHFLIGLRIYHPIAAVITCILLIRYAYTCREQSLAPEVRKAANVLVSLVACQFILGVLSWLLLAPIPLQILHLLGADALWISTFTLVLLSLEAPPREKGLNP